jgi:hypothetical protein
MGIRVTSLQDMPEKGVHLMLHERELADYKSSHTLREVVEKIAGDVGDRHREQIGTDGFESPAARFMVRKLRMEELLELVTELFIRHLAALALVYKVQDPMKCDTKDIGRIVEILVSLCVVADKISA